MNTRSIFDRLAILVVVCVAFIQATQQALKDAPAVTTAIPVLQLTGSWNYVPLLLLCFAAVFWILGRITPPATATPIPKVAPATKIQAAADQKGESSELAKPISAPEKIFLPLNITPETMRSKYSGQTDHEGKRSTELYIGKWMRVRGKFANLSNIYGDLYAVDLKDENIPWMPSYHHLSLSFEDKRSVEVLQLTSIGQEILFIGKVTKVSRSDVVLSDCEMLSLDSDLPSVRVGYKESVGTVKAPRKRSSSSTVSRVSSPKPKPPTNS